MYYEIVLPTIVTLLIALAGVFAGMASSPGTLFIAVTITGFLVWVAEWWTMGNFFFAVTLLLMVAALASLATSCAQQQEKKKQRPS